MSDSTSKAVDAFINGLIALKENIPEEKGFLVDKLLKEVKKCATTGVTHMKSRPDYLFVPPFNTEIVEWEFDNWTPRKGDLLIASYPKTGTTWVREICRQIIYRNDEESMRLSKSFETPFVSYLEGGSVEKFEIVDLMGMKRRVWVTHLPAEIVNLKKYKEMGLKIIYVMRNPKDTIISMKKFFEGLPWNSTPEMKKFLPSDLHQFIQNLVSGEVPMMMKSGEWYPHHIKSWLSLDADPNFLKVVYEEIKKDPHKEIKKISNFLDAALNDKELDEVVEKTSFGSMKQMSSLKSVQMFRKGGVGGWKDHMTDDQSELIEKKMAEVLPDYQFIYSI